MLIYLTVLLVCFIIHKIKYNENIIKYSELSKIIKFVVKTNSSDE